MRLILSILLLICLNADAANWYVSTNGSGDGSLGSPWDIATGLASASVQAGDTVYLRAGTYGTGVSWSVSATFDGSSGSPITIRPYTGERATIDGRISINGDYVTVRDLEVFNSSTNRVVGEASRVAGIALYGLGSKAVNNIVHDVGQPGIWYDRTVGDVGEVYGNVIWGCGLYDLTFSPPGTARGNGVYAQSDDAHTILNNIAFHNVGQSSIKAATGAGEEMYGISMGNNISFLNPNGGLHVSAGLSIPLVVITNNYSYGEWPAIEVGNYLFPGWNGGNHGTVVASNNVIGGSIEAYKPFLSANTWTNYYVTHNTFWQAALDDDQQRATLFWSMLITNVTGATYSIDRNSYYGSLETAEDSGNLEYEYGEQYSFHYTQTNKNWEANGSFNSDTWPTTNLVFAITNKYESGRAHLAIYNVLSNNTQTVSFALLGLANGQAYTVKDSQNFYGTAIASGTYNSSSPNVTIPLTNTACVDLIGNVTNVPSKGIHTDIKFNAFVVLPGEVTAITGRTGIVNTVRVNTMKRR